MNKPLSEGPATRERVVKAAGWSALQSWGARIISLAVFTLLARLLDPAHFGLIAVALVFITLIQTIVENSFGESIIQRAELTDDHLHTAFWINAALGTLLACAIVLGAAPIAQLMREPALVPIIRWLAPVCVLAGFVGVHQALLLRSMGFRALALRSMVATLVSGVAAVFAALLGFGVWALVIQSMVFAALNLVLVWVACPWRPRLRFSAACAGQLTGFAVHSLGAKIGDFLNSRLIDLLIGYYLGAVALGFYSIGYKLVMILNQMLTQITTQVSLTTFSRLQADPERMRRAFYEAVQLTCLFALPPFLALSVLAADLVPFLFGAKWQAAVPLLEVLSYLGVIFAVGNLFATVAAASGRPDLRLCLIMVRVVAGLLLFYVLREQGLMAIAGGYTLAALVSLPLGFLFARRLIGIEFLAYLRACAPALAGGIGMLAAAALLARLPGYAAWPGPARIVCSGAVMLAVYVPIVLLVERSLWLRISTIVQLARAKRAPRG